MAHYVVTGRQMAATAICLAAMLTVSVIGALTYYEWKQLPEVWMDGEKCTKVVNFKNGDAYQCQDVGVVLRNYRLVR